MKTKYYAFSVMNLKAEHHIRHSQEPSNSGNSDNKMFYFPGFINMPNATVQQTTMNNAIDSTQHTQYRNRTHH